jgi:pSer/pThr/pTyr-binding forkhead associated (FHA) protein
VNLKLFELQRAQLLDPKGFNARYPWPVLVWAGAPKAQATPGDSEGSTQAGGGPPRPASGEVVIVPVVKQDSKANAFAMGITVGRVGSNDVVLDDPSVSRFHAYFQHDERKDTWSVTDAGSQNGTQLNGKRIEGRQPIEGGARLVFGEVVLRFLLPEGVRAWLEAGADVTALG